MKDQHRIEEHNYLEITLYPIQSNYEKENKIDLGTPKILAPDSEEQLRYNTLIESIVDYKDCDEYKYKTSFKYKILKFLKLVK